MGRELCRQPPCAQNWRGQDGGLSPTHSAPSPLGQLIPFHNSFTVCTTGIQPGLMLPRGTVPVCVPSLPTSVHRAHQGTGSWVAPPPKVST